MNSLRELYEKAHQLFGLNSPDNYRGRLNPFYVEVPARLSRGGLDLNRDHPLDREEPPELETHTLLSPVSYLARLDRDTGWWFDHQTRHFPSISIVVGEYGLGKTELLHCVAEVLRERSSGIDVLPISLAKVRGLSQMKKRYEPKEFLNTLLDPIEGSKEAVLDEIIERLGDGSLVLLLDALDELVHDDSGHHYFLDSLGTLAEYCNPRDGFHFVLSMRLEYLTQIHQGESLIYSGHTLELAVKEKVKIEFLLLDFFSEAMVKDYICFRFENKNTDVASDDNKVTIDQLPSGPDFRDLLRRPLLARILCDLICNRDKPRTVLSNIKGINSPAALLRLCTLEASRDPILISSQEEIHKRLSGLGRHSWSHRKLSEAALEAYLSGQSELDRKAIEGILEPPLNEKEKRGIEDDDLWMIIYKCPFLGRVGSSNSVPRSENVELRVAFTHRVFLEYFVTEGVVSELKDTEIKIKKNLAFHNLVLDVDMHRFLRDLTILSGATQCSNHEGISFFTIDDDDNRISVSSRAEMECMAIALDPSPEDDDKVTKSIARKYGEEVWYTETGRAYGLEKDCEGEWREFQGELSEEREELDDIRCELLDARSGLKTTPEEWEKLREITVPNFIKKDLKYRLAPRYLIPNYEAVGVCLLNPRIGNQHLHREFEKLLNKRLKDTIDRLNTDHLSVSEREIYELLVERVLNVGYRCGYSWIREPHFVSAPDADAESLPQNDGVLIVIGNRKTRRRIKNLLGKIKERYKKSMLGS